MGKNSNKNRTYRNRALDTPDDNRPFHLSQCMIVKNEENNIEKALSWAKGIAFEQIVVDTGSTDRTVDIAKSLGATVYHFNWVEDFSAAKNFAIEKATGDWIAFLDADEYFSDIDAIKLSSYLKQIESDPSLSSMKTALINQWVHLDDNGQPFDVGTQQRVFRNAPEIRYAGNIHESLTLSERAIDATDLSILHTGYSKTSYTATGKAERNIAMIEAGLSSAPNDANLKCYLADSLRARNSDGDLEKAEHLYREALSSSQIMLEQLREGAYGYLITAYFDDNDKATENLECCRSAYEEFPTNPDFCYYYARKLFALGDFDAAWGKLKACENALQQNLTNSRAGYIIQNPLSLFYLLVLVADRQGNTAEVIRCATLMLKEDKYDNAILAPYIHAFNRDGHVTSAGEIFSLLSKLYDFSNTRDKLTAMQAAKNAGNTELVNMILSTFSKDELDWLTGQ